MPFGTEPRLGYGALFDLGNDLSPQTFSTVAQMKSIQEIGAERGLVDVTNFDSPNAFMQYILSLQDGIEMNITGNFLPNAPTQNSATGMIAAQNTGTERDFRIRIRDSYTLATVGRFNFAGLVRRWGAPVEVAGLMEVTFVVKITGPITYQEV